MVTNMATAQKGQQYIIREVKGEPSFMSRLFSHGLTPGTKIEIKQSGLGMPILVQARETLLAVAANEAQGISVETA
jgi:Fe2+ transport system protein FeoA